jgi:hypothetical protein
MTYWAQALKTFMRAREEMPESRVCDLYYNDVRRDPIAAAHCVYDHFGWKFSQELEERMTIVLAQQNSHSNGVHRYDAAYFRLQGMNGFSAYCERFGFSCAASNGTEERAEAAA